METCCHSFDGGDFVLSLVYFDPGEKRWYRFLGGSLMLLLLMAFLINIISFLYWIGFVKKYTSLLSEFVEGGVSAFYFSHRFQDSYRKEGRLILISSGFSGILERLALDVDHYLGSVHQRESRDLIDKVLLSRAKEALANVEAGVARRSIYGSPNR